MEAGHSTAPRFRVRLTAPGVACPGCGEWNLIITPETESDILGAVANALGTLPAAASSRLPSSSADDEDAAKG